MKKLFVLFLSLLISFIGVSMSFENDEVLKLPDVAVEQLSDINKVEIEIDLFLLKHQNLIDRDSSETLNIYIYNNKVFVPCVFLSNHKILFCNLYDRSEKEVSMQKVQKEKIYLDMRTYKDNLCRYLRCTV